MQRVYGEERELPQDLYALQIKYGGRQRQRKSFSLVIDITLGVPHTSRQRQ